MEGLNREVKQQIDPKKLSRAGDQLRQLEKKLTNIQELNNGSAILKESLQLLQLRTSLKTAGAHSRLLLTLHCAFIGSLAENSAAGFIGKGMDTVQKGFTELMTIGLDNYQPGMKAFIRTALDLLGMGMVFLTSEVLGQWKERFKGYNQSFTQSSGALYRELSVLFMTVSGQLDGIFHLLSAATDLKESERKTFTDLGRLYLLLVILYTSEGEKSSKSDELWESLQRYIKEAIPAVVSGVEKAINRETIDKNLSAPILSYLQVMETALDNEDTKALQRAMEEVHVLMGISKEDLQRDLSLMRDTCRQIAQNLGYASSSAQQTRTQIIQST